MKHPRLVLALVLAFATGCAGSGSPSQSKPLPPGVDLRHVTLTAAQLDDLAGADERFATDLYAAAATSGSGNLVISPVSVAIALQMAYAGARGRTATEMAEALHVTGQAPTDVAAAAARFLADLAPLAHDRSELLALANDVWVQSGFALTPSYESAMRTGFDAGLRRTDFAADPEGSGRAINGAVADQTHDRIRDLLPADSITPDVRLVLTNAVSLLAKWQSPFDPDSTEPRPFHRSDGSQVFPDTMERQSIWNYVHGDGYQAVQLPYAGGRLAMTILLPNGGLAPLEQRLAAHGLAALTASARATKLTLELPRFRFTWAADLKGPLTKLGMTTAFSDAADFSGMTAAANLKIGLVQHQAFVAVDEKGTEAAAATAVTIRVGGGSPGPAGRVLDIDHPFLFAITDTTTGLPLFLGRVTDPS